MQIALSCAGMELPRARIARSIVHIRLGRATRRIAAAVAAALALAAAAPSAPAQQAAAPRDTLIIGTKTAPPFAIKDANGRWSGIAIELWEEMARDLGLHFRYEERDLAGLLAGVGDGSLDAAVAAITVTPDREAKIDFTHPFYSTGLGIATTRERSGILDALSRLISPAFLGAVGVLAAVLLGVGLLIWLLERRRNPAQFGGGPLRGIGSGFWWSAVTMTTVGYGDKAPATPAGRLIGVIWMFAAIIIISGFTAAIASSLTVGQLKSRVTGVKDLPDVRVATMPGTSSAGWLDANRIRHGSAPSPEEGLRAVAAGRLDAFVYDAPILRYLTAADPELAETVTVLPDTMERQDYAIALPQDSPLRERLNRALLERVLAPGWQTLLEKYLGRSGAVSP